MKESNFAREIVASCKALNIAYWKIPDSFPIMPVYKKDTHSIYMNAIKKIGDLKYRELDEKAVKEYPLSFLWSEGIHDRPELKTEILNIIKGVIAESQPEQPQMRFTPPKPFDGFMIHKGRPFCLEFKMVKKKEAFPFNKVADHQIEELLRCQKAGGVGLLLINYRFEYYGHTKDSSKIMKKKFNRVIILEIGAFLELKNALDRKSLPIENLRSFEYIIRIPNPNGKGRIWDMGKLVEMYGGAK